MNKGHKAIAEVKCTQKRALFPLMNHFQLLRGEVITLVKMYFN